MRSIFEKLSPHQYYQFFVAITANIPFTSEGMQQGWTSPTLPRLRSENSPVKIKPEDEAWLEASYMLSALAALPVTTFLPNFFGRKKSISTSAIAYLIAWVVLASSRNRIHLYIGRCVAGFASNLAVVVVPMYTAEIADAGIRGFLTGLSYFMLVIGTAVMYSAAPFVPFYIPPAVASAFLIWHLVTFWPMPESPYHLLTKGQLASATESLQKLTGKRDVSNEIENISRALEGEAKSKRWFFREVRKKNTRRALACITLLNIAQQFCGYSVIIMNSHTILEEANFVYFDANKMSIVLSVIQLTAVTVLSLIVDKFGRRSLLIFSGIFTGFSLVGLGVYFHLLRLQFCLDFVKWLPSFFLILYFAVFNLGLSVIPKIMDAELFSNEFKAIGMTFADGVHVASASVSLLLYNYIVQFYELFCPFYILGGCSFIVAILTYLVIPETKGKSLEEIQEDLAK